MRYLNFSFNKKEYIWPTSIKVLMNKSSNKQDRELHTRCDGSPGMMLENYIPGAMVALVWCWLSLVLGGGGGPGAHPGEPHV